MSAIGVKADIGLISTGRGSKIPTEIWQMVAALLEQ
jgi:hypothetical protein